MARIYSVKEIYYTLQGEGQNTGRAAVFCRFTGCNLWTGLEKDRKKAICQFCDTDFVGTNGPGAGKFNNPQALANAIHETWRQHASSGSEAKPLVVCTGGEPLLQLDEAAVAAFHDIGFEVAVETNGTIQAPVTIDHICVSPKIGADLVQTTGHELKLVYPQSGGDPAQFEHLDFTAFYLQPMDDDRHALNIEATADYVRSHPKWRLSLQTHKMIGIP